jgi:hypothetical protein
VIARLGVVSRGPLADHLLRTSVFRFLHDTQLPFERLWFDWYGGAAATPRAMRSPEAARYREPHGLLDDLARYAPRDPSRQHHAYFARASPCTMLIDEVEAIWTPVAERDDWSMLASKLEKIAAMREAHAFDASSYVADPYP